MAHRDYNRNGANVQIDIFDDRIEITSPGGLLPGLDIKLLEGVHETRNKEICKIFHETKDMEKYGTGIRKMSNLMKQHGLKPPVLFQPGDFFRIIFYGPGDKILDLVSDIPENRQTDLKELGLNERQVEALRLMVNEGKILTNTLYQRIFKVARRTALRDLQGLVETEQAKMIGIGKGAKYKAG
jgi:ATP-dependent DNA helicase RecG